MAKRRHAEARQHTNRGQTSESGSDDDVSGDRRRESGRQPPAQADRLGIGQRQGHRRGQTEQARFGHFGRGRTPTLATADEQHDRRRARQPERQRAPPGAGEPAQDPESVDHHDQGGALHEEPAHGSRPVPSAQSQPAGRRPARRRNRLPARSRLLAYGVALTSQIKVCRRLAAAREQARAHRPVQGPSIKTGLVQSKTTVLDASPRRDGSRSPSCQFLVGFLYSSLRISAARR